MALVYEFEGFRLDHESRRLMYRGKPIKLTAKACSVLAVLADRAPEVVSRAEFEAVVWPEGFIEPANLTQTIYMLRKALSDVGPAPIETVNGRGYRLCAVVERGEAGAKKPRGFASFGRAWRIAASVALLAAALVIAFGLTRYVQIRAAQTATLPSPAGAIVHPQAAPNRS